ncbi:chitin synthase chs-2-like isoform X2 [Argopecten irradians]|uniref:chitin synthase chs-2-like isoform X2 n=1 Tax=Argopecten irradians TaxID=31199 RepID=UPI0037160AD7
MADVEDISQLENFDNNSIRQTIKERYNKDKIYTNCGDILIAVNPYKSLSIFGERQHQQYDWKVLQRPPPPHVFYTAARAYGRMLETATNQVILVGGESGAGKTESAKYMVKHLVSLCPGQSDNLQERIVNINPLLEAFGNAKTTMNDNSSRFAKYLEMTFSGKGRIQGAIVRDYLLEKSRVVDQLANEGNFHIFYGLFAGASASMLRSLRLKDASTYRILKRNKDLLSRNESHRNIYLGQIEVLKAIDMNPQDIDVIHTVLAAILHITQVEFVEPDDPNEPLQIPDIASVQNAAELLSVSCEELGHALIATKQTYVGEVIVKRKSMSQAIDSRDALAKALYERLFGWIVRQINMNLHTSIASRGNTCIGILDIAGFENLRSNSLEQICINIINERLQNFMNKNIVDFEMSIYQQEGIHIPYINFRNNDELLHMFMKKTFGFLPLLDEQSKLGHGSNERFIKNLKENYDDHGSFSTSPHSRTKFCVRHFAGPVWYDSSMLIEKNRDLLSPDVATCMEQSRNPFISDLFTVRKGPTGTISATGQNIRKSRKMAVGRHGEFGTVKNHRTTIDIGRSLKERYKTIEGSASQVYTPKDQKTVVSYFQTSMNDLLTKMKQAEPHYVRCIKPNMCLQPSNFDDEKVSEQIRYNGISEVAKIRKLGLPVRKRYDEFTKRYRQLFFEQQEIMSHMDKTNWLIQKILPVEMKQQIRFGQTRLFMTEDVSVWLEKLRGVRQRRAANTIKRRWKEFMRERKRKHEESMADDIFNQYDRVDGDSDMAVDLGPSFKPNHSLCLENEPGQSWNSVGSHEQCEAFNHNTIDTNDVSSDSDDDNTSNTYNMHSPIDARKLASSIKPGFDYGKKKKVRAPSPPGLNRTTNQQHKMKEEDNSPKKTTPKAEKEFWDIFNIISRESNRKDPQLGFVMKTLKLLTYILLSVLLLFCCASQKIWLFKLISSPSELRNTMLVTVICIPYVLMFIVSLWRSVFKNVHFPSKKYFIILLVIEGLHSFGLSLFTFRVLMEIDVARGVLLLNSTGIVPSILKLTCASNSHTNNRSRSTGAKICIFILDLLAALVQISAIPLLILNENFLNNSNNFFGNQSNLVYGVIALLLCTLSHWENFVDDRLCGRLKESSRLHALVLGLKFDLQECRPVIYTVAAPLKIFVTGLVSFYLAEPENKLDFDLLANFFDRAISVAGIPFVFLIIFAIWLGNFVAYTACKLQMQRVSFAFPLFLSTPVAALGLLLDCMNPSFLGIDTDQVCDIYLFDVWWHLPVAAAWFVSMYWVGRYIWFPSQPRLAKMTDLFTSPFCCGILMEQHLILTRRRHTRKIIKVHGERNTYYRLMPESVRESHSEGEDKTGRLIPPMIYACGSLWHESRQEMVHFLKSIFRMDKDQFLRKKAVNTFDVDPADVNYYEYEPHIFFDDAFETNASNERVPNTFVKLFSDLMEEAASSVHEKVMTLNPPIKILTPYGGQLVYLMPGENIMFVHLKDKDKIRPRKRWSQVMYMYYLLGYRILKECQEVVMTAIRDNAFNDLVSWRQFERQRTGQVEKSQIFNFLDDEILYRAKNTFLLTLDGDIDFTPAAVQLLMDKMRKNDRVGAVCGRIHPIGKGPVVWFQKFEYAIIHWLQKATEHVFGCVLCSPGCFSLFRGSSLMDDNVMRKYTSVSNDASDYIMYDQGEDRWLCSLLLQQGYRIDYTAAADAYTYAPEKFDEFFNQRRRWIPSTIANIMDLLQDGKNVVAVNNDISWLYIFYLYLLMLSTALGPGLVVMMIAGALISVFDTDIISAYVIATVPAVVYAIMCLLAKPKYQILAAQALGALYIFIMAIVFVGIINIAVQENPLHPSVIFIEALILDIIFCAIIHPREFSNVIYATIYYMCMPVSFLLLMIYCLCNMHIMAWGTREIPKIKTQQEIEEEEKLEKEKEEMKNQGFLARFLPRMTFNDISHVLDNLRLRNRNKDKMLEILRTMNTKFEMFLKAKQSNGANISADMMDADDNPEIVVHDKQLSNIDRKVRFDADALQHDQEVSEKANSNANNNEIKETNWVSQSQLGNGRILQMNAAEEDFWKSLINRYLYPLENSVASQERIRTKLTELRNNVCAGIGILNLLWIAVNFMFQLRKPAVIYFTVPDDVDEENVNTNSFEVDVLGLLYVIFFGGVLLIQSIGMYIHRWGTFLQLISATSIPSPLPTRIENEDEVEFGDPKYVAEKVLDFCERLDAEAIPEYAMNSDDEKEEEEKVTRALEEVIMNIQKKGTKNIPGSRNPLGKSIRQSEFGRNARRPGGTSTMVKSLIKRTTRKDTHVLDETVKQRKDMNATTSVHNTNEHNKPKFRFGAGVPLQKHFISEVRHRRLPNTPDDLTTKERLSHTLTRDDYDPDTLIDYDDDPDCIYDTIPSICAMDKAFSKNLKKYRAQEQQDWATVKSNPRNYNPF